MSETRQADEDKSDQNDDQNIEQLKHLTLNGENGVSTQDQFTPTLNYLQVP